MSQKCDIGRDTRGSNYCTLVRMLFVISYGGEVGGIEGYLLVADTSMSVYEFPVCDFVTCMFDCLSPFGLRDQAINLGFSQRLPDGLFYGRKQSLQ